MGRFATFVTLLVLLLTTYGTSAGARVLKPQPLPEHFDFFFVLNARQTDLRLFIPAQTHIKPHHLHGWEQQLDAYIGQWLQKKKSMPQEQFLEQFFYDVHKRYLKQYTPYAGLQALMQSGEYNCLSAAVFYSLLLERLGYNYSIVESVNHVLLLVNLPDKQFLLETTDPVKGFVNNAVEIENRLNRLKNGEQSQQYYKLNIKVFRTIGLRELAGLQFYNYAAWYFNQGDLANAALHLKKGKLLYKSDRFDKVADLLLSAK